MATQLRSAAALAGRETRRVISLWGQTLAPAVVNGLLFLAIFGGALGSQLNRVAGIEYSNFILPGLLVMTVAAQAFGNNSTSVFQAKNEGYIEDMLTSPIRPTLLTAAFMSGGVLRGLLAAAIIAVTSAPFTGGVDHVAVLAIVLVLTALLFGALGVITGIWADTFDQHSFIANVVVAPLALVGGVFYAAERLPAPWSTLTRLDPIYYLVDASRGAATGYHESATALSVAIAAVLVVASFTVAARLVAVGWRIKP